MTSEYLLLAFLLLVAGSAEALLPIFSLDLPPNAPQSLGEDDSSNDTPLDTAASSAWLDNASSETMALSLSLSNSSLALNNISAGVRFMCQDRFGSNLNLRSCQSAALSIEYQLTRDFTWGPRGSATTYDFPMPQRWVSCT